MLEIFPFETEHDWKGCGLNMVKKIQKAFLAMY
jgi:hypothetical protein